MSAENLGLEQRIEGVSLADEELEKVSGGTAGQDAHGEHARPCPVCGQWNDPCKVVDHPDLRYIEYFFKCWYCGHEYTFVHPYGG